MSLNHTSLPIDEAYKTLSEQLNTLEDTCLRYELCINKEKNVGFDIILKALPGSVNRFADDSRLSGSDVAGIIVDVYKFNCYTFDEGNDDLNQVYPFCPVLFCRKLLSLQDFREIVRKFVPALMLKFRIHRNLSYEEAITYVASPKMESGNFLRYPDVARNYTNPLVPPSISAGSQIVSKFGPKFELINFVPILPPFLLRFVGFSLTSNTWASYKCSWLAYFKFIKHMGYTVTLPASSTMLLKYVNYLRLWRSLKASTMRSYISGLKKLHILNYRPISQFDDPNLENFINGVENLELVFNEKTLQRNVITFNVLKILGHAVFTSHLNNFDKLVLWTVFLVMWWTASRIGEMVSNQVANIDTVRAIFWSKILSHTPDHFTIYVALPKVTEDERAGGHFVELQSFSDRRYCPIDKLKALHEKCWERGRGRNEDLVFVWSSGKQITSQCINKMLEQLLRPFFPDPIIRFSSHSFRAGITSHMASEPDSFTESDCKVIGRWKSDAVKRYQRMRGIAHGRAIKKFHTFLNRS